MSVVHKAFSFLVVTMVVTSGVVAFTGALGAEAASFTTGHGDATVGNYTVAFPNPEDQYPRGEHPDGEHQSSVYILGAGTSEFFQQHDSPAGFEALDQSTFYFPNFDFSECGLTNVAAAGYDRDDDDPGTQTDLSTTKYVKDNKVGEEYTWANMYGGDEVSAPPEQDKGGKGQGQGEGRADGDSNLEVYEDDQVVTVWGEGSQGGACVATPEEPGWYQSTIRYNGTNWAGEYVDVEMTSHYFYICTCDSRQEAVDTLGPPPSENGGNGQNETSTEIQTSEGTEPPESTESPEATDPPESTEPPEATASPESTEPPEATDAPESTEPPEATDPPEATTTSTDTAADGGDGVTPTSGDGPGFGLIATIVGLVAGSLFVLKRTE